MQAQNLDQRKRIADQEASRRRLQVNACVITTIQLAGVLHGAGSDIFPIHRLTKKIQHTIFMKHVHEFKHVITLFPQKVSSA